MIDGRRASPVFCLIIVSATAWYVCPPPFPASPTLSLSPIPPSLPFKFSDYSPPGIAKALECELGCLPPPFHFPSFSPSCLGLYVCVLLHRALTVRPLQDFHRSPRQTSLKLLTWRTLISGLSRPCRPTVYLLTFAVAFESKASNQSSLFQTRSETDVQTTPTCSKEKMSEVHQGLHAAAHSLQQQKCTFNTDYICKHFTANVRAHSQKDFFLTVPAYFAGVCNFYL